MSLKFLSRFFILYLYFSVNLSAQSYTVDIRKLSVEDGLSSRFTTDLYQDSHGFMWIGTRDGLNRYDGYRFKHYTSQNSALTSDEILRIKEDQNQKLWIIPYVSYNKSAPYFTVDILDLQTGHIQSFDEVFKGIAPFAAKDVNQVFSDDEKAIWISTVKNDLYRYHNKRFKHIFSPEKQKDLIIFNTKKKNALVFSEKKELLIINSKGNTIKKFPLSDRSIRRINDEKNKNLWFFQPKQKKLLYLDPEEDALQEIDLQLLNLPEAFYSPNIARISVSADNLIWWWSQKDTSDQFFVLHPDKGIVFDLQPEIASLLSYEPLKIRNIYFDAGNRAWVATEDGIFIIDLKRNKFTTLLSDEPENYSVRGIVKDDQGRLYINTLNGRVRIDTETGTLKKNNPGTLWLGATKDIQGNLWFSHQTTRIEKYNPLNGQSQDYYAQGNEEKTYQWSQWTIIRDKTGRVWTGTHRGLYYLDPQTGVYRKFDRYNGFSILEESTVYHLYEDKAGIWIGASSGLYLLESGKGITTRYTTGEKRPYCIPYDHIIHFYRDTAGIFWLATKGGGLIRFNPGDGSYRQFTTTEGLSNNTIYAVYEDDYGKLWLPSNYGLMQFDKKSYQVNTYLKGDGIAHEEFNRTSHYRDVNGRLYFGGLAGVTIFDPEDFSVKGSSSVPLQLTGCRVLNGKTGALRDNTITVINSGELTLSPSDRSFIIQFSLLNYKNSRQNSYAYKIEGLDKNWTSIGGNSLRINSLPYGSYTLRIKGQSIKGERSENELTVAILVKKPFYLKNSFILGCTLALALIIYGIFRWRLRSLNQAKLKLQETVKQRTREIQRQKDTIEEDKIIIEQQAERLKELNVTQSRWFTNIAHELRTPLTLILGPIRQFLKTHSGKTTKAEIENIQLAEKNSTGLLKLVNEILNVSKLDSNRLKINKAPVNLTHLTREAMAHFDSAATQKGVISEIQITDNININADKDHIQKILINLISNALKFTHTGGKITVSVHYKEEQDIKVSVTDTGAGIPEKDLPHIFERYFQTSDPDRINQGGAGIGLALSLELARLHGGGLSAESIPGKGSVFILSLPEKLIIDTGRLPSQLLNTVSPPRKINIKPLYKIAGEQQDKPLVLLVEDNPDMRTYIRGFMAGHYEMAAAADGLEALEFLEKTIPELIISDIMMPRMDGIKLAKTLKNNENFKNIPFITLTAKADEPDKIAVLRIGIDDYLTKPFNAEELEARVANLIHNYRERRRAASKTAPDAIEAPTYYDQQVISMKNFIMNQLQNDAFTINDLAVSQNMSPRSLNRFLKKATGLSPGQFIREIRLQQGRRLLEAKQYPTILEVVYATGFENASYFTKLFSERFGKKPSEYL